MSGKHHILIVDDQLDNCLILEDLLGEYYDVHTANDGEEALIYLESDAEVDLIVTDVRMPGISGFELCERIKAMPERRSIPLLFLTGLLSDEERDEGLALGAVGFITKPFTLQTILDQVNSWLPQS